MDRKKLNLTRVSVGIGLVSVLLAALFNLDPSNDVAHLYARQVRLIAAGELDRGLFLFPPPLLVLIASGFAVLGVPAFAALKLVSGLFFVAGLWPLSRIVKHTVGTRFIPWAALLYIACPRILRYATMGTPDTAKMFFLLCVVALVFELKNRVRWQTTALLAMVTALLALTRGETVFFIPPILLLMAWCVWSATRRETPAPHPLHGSVKTILHSILFATIVIAFLLPQMLRVHRYTGIPALDSRQVMRFTTISEPAPTFQPEENTQRAPSSPSNEPENAMDTAPEKTSPTTTPVADIATTPDMIEVEILPPPRDEDRVTVWRNIRESVKGLHPFILLFAMIGLAIKMRRKQWTWHDLVFIGVIGFNIFLFACNGFITKRYTAPTMPFLLPWCVIGLAAVKDNWLDRIAPNAFAVLAGLFVIIGVWDGMSDVRPSWDFELEECHVVGLWVREHRTTLPDNPLGSLHWNASSTTFHDGRQPVIAAVSPQISFWGEADWVPINYSLQRPYSLLVEKLRANRVDLLAVEDSLLRTCPNFFTHHLAHFTEIEGVPEGTGIRLFHFHPNGVTENATSP